MHNGQIYCEECRRPKKIKSFVVQMFCVADPSYDKSIQQLQSFLSGLVSEEKLELRDGMYLLKK